ncbi:metallophosphoesterase family protein [Listeria valentina]|uniref:metallophosphoesterase family protein n=1 Tax=Listeria valentina TaxID=2705293 RepID=UPI001431B645|nr:DNA repair exonuclease [Listeria valentina]
MAKVRFLHIADLHLDSPFTGLSALSDVVYKELKDAAHESLVRIVTRAIAEQVDFVLIAGDVYDKEDRSIKAQVQFYKEMKRLQDAEIDVFLIHGNHDFLEKDRDVLELPENVFTFGETVQCVPWKGKFGQTVNLYGFSYTERHVREKRLNEFQKQGEADFHIALLHGSEETKSSEHDVYAPFSLSELKQKGFDYWALGHIHKREILSEHPGVYYPGNIQGRSRKETGAKGGTIVELSPRGASFEFFETAPVIWGKLQIELDGKVDQTKLFRKLEQALQDYRNGSQSYILDLEVLVENPDGVNTTDWLQMFEDEVSAAPFVWVNTLKFRPKQSEQNEDWQQDLLLADELKQSIQELQEEENFFEAIESLYLHAGVRQYLTELDEDKQKQLLSDALVKLNETYREIEDGKK